MNNIKTAKLKITGMHCSSCAMNIDFTLEDTPGVISANTSYAKEEVDIKFDCKKISISEIINSITKLNYKVYDV